MKKKILKYILSCGLVACFCFSFAFSFSTSGVLAEAEVMQVVVHKNGQDHQNTFTMEYKDAIAESKCQIDLHVQNFDFEKYLMVGQNMEAHKISVVYSYLKQGTSNYVYSEIEHLNYTPITQLTVTDADVTLSTNPNGKVTVRPYYDFGGIGTYFIKAYVMVDDEIFYVDNPFTLIIEKPKFTASQVSIIPSQTHNPAEAGQIGDYTLSVKVEENKNPVDLTYKTVTWYVVTYQDETESEVASRKFCGNGKQIIWEPTSSGHYTLEVSIPEYGETATAKIAIDAFPDYTLYIIIGASALGAVMLAIVIAVTVNSVKKERVW